MANFTIVYDACVLHPPAIRDLLMRLALTDLFRAKWSDDIHQEWMRSVQRRRPDIAWETLARVRDLMNANVRDCLVDGYEELIPALTLPDANDRHVLAAAIRGRADVIVTYNLRDFPDYALSQYGIEAQHPDEFVSHLIDLDASKVLAAVREQRAALMKPPVDALAFVERLEARELTQTGAFLREFLRLI
ncbi:MAG: PIN domain-containing protein [Phycisphaerales bacterium JB060]